VRPLALTFTLLGVRAEAGALPVLVQTAKVSQPNSNPLAKRRRAYRVDHNNGTTVRAFAPGKY